MPLAVLDVLSFPFSAVGAVSFSPRFGHCLFTARDSPMGESPGRNNLFLSLLETNGGEKNTFSPNKGTESDEFSTSPEVLSSEALMHF